MSALKNVAQKFHHLWGQADDDDDYAADEESDERESAQDYPQSHSSRGEKYEKYTVAPNSSPSTPHMSHGGGSGSHLRKLRPISNPLRSSREKNIYTLKPKSMDEVSLAADYLKTGCAVVLNLDDVERSTAVRVIDFMSGVCYGLDHQGHAMKLGDTIFLFTPGDFEISSDETDYGENRDFIFRDVSASDQAVLKAAAAAATAAPTPVAQNTFPSTERRSWER